jgi:hypothetical protein
VFRIGHGLRSLLPALAVALVAPGCWNSRVVRLPEYGFELTIPAGWRLDPEDRTSFYDSDDGGSGWVAAFELDEGESFDNFVNEALDELALPPSADDPDAASEPTRVISRSDQETAGFQSVEVLATNGDIAILLFIDLDGAVIEVRLEAPAADFQELEPELRRSLASITFR